MQLSAVHASVHPDDVEDRGAKDSPGCPEFALSTVSADSTRMVFTHFVANVSAILASRMLYWGASGVPALRFSEPPEVVTARAGARGVWHSRE